MQSTVVFITLLGIAISELDPKRGDYVLQCAKEHGMDVFQLHIEDYIEKKENEPKFRCYVKCLMNKQGLISENGEFNENAVRNKAVERPINDNKMARIVRCAQKQNHEDMCRRIYKMADCIYEEEYDR